MQELSQTDFREWRRIITGALKAFQTVCREHGLRYYAAGGTALGAVRHKGIIPWDDDIDVAMPRPDYERLLSVCRHTPPEGYEVVTAATPDYNLPFAKFCDARTTLIERADTPCLIGLYIDVFPLDAAPDDARRASRLMRRYRKACNRLEAVSTHVAFGEYLALLATPREWGRFATKTLGFLFRSTMRRRLLGSMDKISALYAWGTTNHVTCYGGSYGDRERYPSAWLEGEPPLLPFEDTMIPLIPGHARHLRQLYGDYMTPPPAEAQKPKHLKAFYDLTRRRTLQEARQAMGA